MPNSYGSYTYDERFSAQQTWTQSRANKGLVKVDLLAEAIAAIMDHDYPEEGLRSGVADPCHIEVAGGTTWSTGWWQSSDSRWWELGKAANVSSFTRAQADFYRPTGDILDVPLS